ncbi:MAG: polyphenol oxidase family protein [Acidimicrobiales bacterium]
MPGSAESLRIEIDDLLATVIVTTRVAGDLRPGVVGSAERLQAVVGGVPCSWTRQVHGTAIICGRASGEPGDAVVGVPAERPAMFAADCALLGMLSPQGVVAAVHVGWRGLRGGVVERAAAAMRSLGARQLVGVRGPCIGPECYEFGRDDLDQIAERYGDTVRGETSAGAPALDLAAAVRAACLGARVEMAHEVDSCTACARAGDGRLLWFSHRARRDEGRHALIVTERG